MKRRSGWRMLGLMLLGMILLAIGGGFWWYYDDGDLEVVREQARQQGRPLSWNDLNLTLADGERLRIWQRIVVLANGLTSYQSKIGPGGKNLYNVWDPIPDEMRAHHAGIDATAVNELATLLDRLGDQPLVLHGTITYARKLPEIGTARALQRFMQERLVLANKDETGVWARRMLASCRRYSSDSLTQHLVRSSGLDIALKGIAFRLEDLKQTDPTIATDIRTTIGPQYELLLRALDGEFLLMLDAVSRPGDSQSELSSDWFMPVITRAGRQGALCAHLDAVERLRLHGGQAALAWASATEAEFDAARGDFPYPSRVLQGLFTPAWQAVVSQGELVVLRGEVLAAELQGTPWPRDRFSPTDHILRPIERDGRVIAAYSVYQDGVDDGGDAKRDRVIPLYADPSQP